MPSAPAVQRVEGAFFPAGGLARPRSDGPAPNSWEESLIGRVLDQRYRIESCIGAGGMGVVYKATHVIIDKPLAIKMLRAEVANQPDVIKRFLLEAQLASRVKHPNVVDISDYGQIAGQTAYYVMEYLVGETLAHRIDSGGRVEPALAVDIAVQTAQALQAAHDGKIIHRDLKSENIFLCERPGGGVQVKILDFGIARIRDKKTRLTAMGALIGTPAYMSPEQAQGADVDERSDLYALGVILFEMLAGRVPFKAATVAMILSAQIFDAPPRLHEIDASVPDLPNLEHVIHRLLAKNRDERPRDAAEVIHLIKTAAEIDLTAATAAGPASGVSSGGSSGANKRRATVTIGSWSVAENPSGLQRVDAQAPAVAGEARSTPRPDADVVVPRPVSASGRIQRRPSVIVPSGTPVERIAAPPTRPPITGEHEARHYPTGVNPAIRSAGPPMILIIAAAASIGAAITVTLYKVWRRNQAPISVQQPADLAAPQVAMTRLTFESEPAGAAVFTEAGERWGVTPFTRELSAASPRTRVVFRLAGHDDLALDVSAGESTRHKVLLRPRIAAPAPEMAPAPPELTTASGLGTASATGPSADEPTAADPAKPAVAAKTKPAKPRPEAPSKAPAEPGPPPKPADPGDDGELDMGELKNPFRKK
ncbi:serine/threonine-protein kinase [Nannocystis sp.]|uniref:serine/threonine-protein kinase n=1 Tax=Nannocystis sp. TaxID=1962667 RepID=UPI0024281302|nr:serine/threonine-protein kinase [Nannocystis sp.]MBK7824089.1 serine/threonine protein kinase [Nannocystis sp.]MBK9755103.1 serine/threonine protein kinase [Nannocystis sp.]